MARQYHLRSFLRDAPNVFLRRYLAEKDIGLQLDWDALGETEIVPIFDAIQEAAPEVRVECEADFLEIDAMATEGGAKTMVAEARFRGQDLRGAFQSAEGDHERAFHYFLKDREGFRKARRCYRADCVPTRSWRKLAGLPEPTPRIDRSSRQQLGESVAAYFRRKDGRGHGRPQVEHYDSGGKLYWFVYCQDYAKTSSEFDEEGTFDWKTRFPAFEIIFVYHRQSRSLDLFAPGSSLVTVKALQQIWADAVLQGDLGTGAKGGAAYGLEALKRRGFPFHLDPADGIEEVRLNRLRLSLPRDKEDEKDVNPRLTVEVNAQGRADAIYDVLDRTLNEQRVSLDDVRVTQAGFQFIFRSHRRGGTEKLNFDVTYPNSCNLKQDPKHEIARGYLRRWGIDVSGSTERNPEAS